MRSRSTRRVPQLTPKQLAFCREYLVDLNATQAAVRAGYSRRSANEQAARALAKASIQAEVRRQFEERMKRVEVDADFVLRTLVENVQRAMQAAPVLDADGNSIGQYRYNGAVANKALELLGRHLGLFTDQHPATQSEVDARFIAQLLQQPTGKTCVIDAAYIARLTHDEAH